MNNAVSFPIPRRPDIAQPIGSAQVMQDVLAAAEDVSPANTTVLLLGESGTGKEVFARYIHALSPRSTGPWIAVNCAALPGELLESELFGHEKGSFTGASDRRLGRIEQADHGTILLDEISEMPLLLQAKLLRVLQERELDRVGGARPIPVDVRIIATSNRDLAGMVAHGEFRADLYYRLSVFPILLPPLRDHREDIPALAAYLSGEIALRLGRPAPTLAPDALANLFAYEFPGNVRELANVLERALVRCHDTVVPAGHIAAALAAVGIASIRGTTSDGAAKHLLRGYGPAHDQKSVANEDRADVLDAMPAGLPLALAALEQMAILEALRRVNGNRTHAARLLGISLRTLRNKLRTLRLTGVLAPDGQLLPRHTCGAMAGAAQMARESQEESAA
jgi:transcriptional regulator with GAF, ATPase, and Fis domain